MPDARPDTFEQTRIILARQRRLGKPFTVAWPFAVAAVDRGAVSEAERRERVAEQTALELTAAAWRAAYEGTPAPDRSQLGPVASSVSDRRRRAKGCRRQQM